MYPPLSTFFKRESLETFNIAYGELINSVLTPLDIPSKELTPDHLGVLTHSSEEFENLTKTLLQYSTQIKEIVLHERRVRVFKLNSPLSGRYKVPKIEIFEPKPNIDITKLRFGVEHIAFQVKNFDEYISITKGKVGIIKEGTVGNSKFAKTEILNTVEIEFRSDALGEEESN